MKNAIDRWIDRLRRAHEQLKQRDNEERTASEKINRRKHIALVVSSLSNIIDLVGDFRFTWNVAIQWVTYRVPV